MKKFERYSSAMPWFTALVLSTLVVGCGGGGGGRDPILGAGNIGALVAPAVTTFTPNRNATGVAVNTKMVTAAFTKAMDASTLTSSNFTLACPAAVPPITGTTVTYIAAGNVARLALPAGTNLPSNTVCTATVTTGVKDTAGIALASNFAWTFTTGDAADTTAPTLMLTLPANSATDVPINQEVIASFSEAMDPLTITDATFTLKRDGVTPVAGNVTLTGTTATFAPSSPLAVNATYTAKISSGTDLAGNALAVSLLNPWTFTTAAAPAPAGPALVDLGCAAGFAILAGSTVTNTGPTIISGGDLGLSPGSAVTGFPPGAISGGVIRINDLLANNAKGCLTNAYNDAAGRTTAPIAVSGNIGGQTLAPGLYKSTSTLAISSGDLTLAGPADAVWIFQVASTLTTTAGRQIILSGGAQAKNIFWQVGTSATLGTTSVFQGNILADQSITLETGAVLNGRGLTRIAAVTLDSNSVTKP